MKRNYCLNILYLIPLLSLNFLEANNDSGIFDTFNDFIKHEIIKNTDYFNITIQNPHFKNFLINFVNNALEEGKIHHLSNELLKCYDKVYNDIYTYSVEECKKILPELIAAVESIQAKAPRPGELPNIAGPETCNLSDLNILLKDLYQLIGECCSSDTVSFDGTFTVLNDLNNTITQCCSFISNEFNGTFSTLNFNFNSTFTLLEVNFNGTFTVIDQIDNSIENAINQFDDCCTNLKNQILACCLTVVSLLDQAAFSLAQSQNLINSIRIVDNDTNCILNNQFPITTC